MATDDLLDISNHLYRRTENWWTVSVAFSIGTLFLALVGLWFATPFWLAFSGAFALIAPVAIALLLALKDLRLTILLPIFIAILFAIAPGLVTKRVMSIFDPQEPTNQETSFDDLSSPRGAMLTTTNAIINYVTPSLNVNLGFALAGGAFLALRIREGDSSRIFPIPLSQRARYERLALDYRRKRRDVSVRLLSADDARRRPLSRRDQ